MAFELCLHGVGGAAHPRELFQRLTRRELMEWSIYVAHFATPMRRADNNSALERQLLFAHFQKPPKFCDLIPQYGKKRTLPTDDEVKMKLRAWIARGK